MPTGDFRLRDVRGDTAIMSKVAIVGTIAASVLALAAPRVASAETLAKDSLAPGAIVEHELATVCARGVACSVRHPCVADVGCVLAGHIRLIAR
jgi:hypothetical protein